MRVLSLFSGGGLGDYGLELAGMEIVGQVEIDEYCQKILNLRWPDVPKWKDIRDVTGKEVIERCGAVDLVSGGFPCQDISVANNKAVGIGGERSGLWKEMFRVISEIRPKFALVENSAMLLSRGIGDILGDLASIGYDAEWECMQSNAFKAPHERKRLWIVAYPNSHRLERGLRQCFPNQDKYIASLPSCFYVDVDGEKRKWEDFLSKPDPSGSDDGMPYWMERTKMLGNAQQVQVVEWIGKRIMEFEANR